MTAAIFGLVGVLLGGLLQGGATYLFARSVRARAVRTASRLAEHELAVMLIFARSSQDATTEGEDIPESHLEQMLRQPALAVRGLLPVLADALTRTHWDAVARCLREAEGMAEGTSEVRILATGRSSWTRSRRRRERSYGTLNLDVANCSNGHDARCAASNSR